MSPPWTQRATQAEDAPFLFELYASTRQEELAGWGWPAAQQEAFLRLQYRAREGSYRSGHPDAEDRLVLLEGAPIGRWCVDRSGDSLHLVDLAVLPAYRGQGIGASLLRALCEEADQADRAVTLQVLEGSPAVRLYLRHGFEPQGLQPPYLSMRRASRAGLHGPAVPRSAVEVADE